MHRFNLMLASIIALLLSPIVRGDTVRIEGLPDATGVAAPRWVEPGTRITYSSNYSVLHVVPGNVTLNDDGDWIDESTGNALVDRPRAVQRTDGLIQVNVVHVDQQNVALDVKSFNTDAASTSLRKINAYVGGPAIGSDYWIHPRLLAGLADRNTDASIVKRMTCTIDGKRYNAVRFIYHRAEQRSQLTYDTKTGVLLSASTFGLDAEGTFVTRSRLLGARYVTIPGATEPMPGWVPFTRSMTYNGEYTSTSKGDHNIPFTMKIFLRKSGNGWVSAGEVQAILPKGTTTPISQRNERAFGSAQLGGIWIHPNTLKSLRVGQTLDEDEYTHARVYVREPSDARYVDIVEECPGEKTIYHYDPAGGTLIGITRTTKDANGMTTHIAAGLTEADIKEQNNDSVAGR